MEVKYTEMKMNQVEVAGSNCETNLLLLLLEYVIEMPKVVERQRGCLDDKVTGCGWIRSDGWQSRK